MLRSSANLKYFCLLFLELAACTKDIAPGQVHDEVVVTFKSTSSRDFVMSHACNLADFVDSSRKPTAGVRIFVPSHLIHQFHDLQNYGRDLHRIHGEGFKRHCKFDDREETLYMDIKLPRTNEWLIIDHEMARDNRKTQRLRLSAETRDRLNGAVSGAKGPEMKESMAAEKSLPVSATLEKFKASSAGPMGSEWE